MKILTMLIVLIVFSAELRANPYGYGGSYTYNYNLNQRYGASNWYSSPLGYGVAEMGVVVVGGIVNGINNRSYIIPRQAPAPIVINVEGSNNGRQICYEDTLYDELGNPVNVNVCK